MTEAPLVSIITPSFQAQHYIEKTIETVQRQTYQNWEMLIADDGSTETRPSTRRREGMSPIWTRTTFGRRISWKNRSGL